MTAAQLELDYAPAEMIQDPVPAGLFSAGEGYQEMPYDFSGIFQMGKEM